MPDALGIALFTYATQPRGGVAHTMAVAEELDALGHRVLLHAIDDGRGFVREPRCPYRPVFVDPMREPLVSFVRRRIDAYVGALEASSERFDVYHAQDGISGNALATLAERGTIPGYVRTVHHLDVPLTRDAEIAALERRAIGSAARVCAVSETWCEPLRDRFDVEATVVGNGVDVGRFHAVDDAARAALRARLEFSGPTFLAIGGIEARKNTLALLDAFALVRASMPGARLVVAGGASVLDHSAYRAAFDARVRELELDRGGALRVAGVLDDEELVAHLRAADALAFPSLVEGFGLVVLEALACATPVVVSRIAPFTSFLAPGDACFVDPNDPHAIADGMRRALDPAFVRAIASRGPRVARAHTWRAVASRHVAVYRSLAPPEKALSHA